ncbi:hypothetical protein T439DRAFT_324897 [Meredithblackwellia eburnea MCA 4105]
MVPPPTGAVQQAEAKPRSSRDDVLSFLDSLDSYSTPPKPVATGSAQPRATATPPPAPKAINPAASAEEAQSVLDFLDEITQRSSTPTTKSSATGDANLAKKSSYSSGLNRSTSKTSIAGGAAGPGGASVTASRKSGESIRSIRSTGPGATPGGDSPSLAPAVPAPVASEQSSPSPATQSGGGWGWSSVWSQASNVVHQATVIAQQAKDVADQQIKNNAPGIASGIDGIRGNVLKALGENEQAAKKWSEGVLEYARGANLDQIGNNLKSQTLRGLTDLLNAVAPPIAEHEVIEVSLSHDLVGYDGIESLVYRGLSIIMDQVEGGTLVINKGEEERPKESSGEDPDNRNLNAVEGLEEAWKMAEANLEELIKKLFKPEDLAASQASSVTIPVTKCPVYLRIQPCLAPLPSIIPGLEDNQGNRALYFLLVLRDPGHKLTHSTLSQSIPADWLDIPFEENEWVEDVMVDVIGRAVQVVGKAYIHARMTAQANAINKAREAAQQVLEKAESASVTPAVPTPEGAATPTKAKAA